MLCCAVLCCNCNVNRDCTQPPCAHTTFNRVTFLMRHLTTCLHRDSSPPFIRHPFALCHHAQQWGNATFPCPTLSMRQACCRLQLALASRPAHMHALSSLRHVLPWPSSSTIWRHHFFPASGVAWSLFSRLGRPCTPLASGSDREIRGVRRLGGRVSSHLTSETKCCALVAHRIVRGRAGRRGSHTKELHNQGCPLDERIATLRPSGPIIQ